MSSALPAIQTGVVAPPDFVSALNPHQIVITPACVMRGYFRCEREDACIACGGLNQAMGLFVVACQSRGQWVTLDRQLIGEITKQALDHANGLPYQLMLDWRWPDFFGLVQAKEFAWVQDAETQEIGLQLTRIGRQHLADWAYNRPPKAVIDLH